MSRRDTIADEGSSWAHPAMAAAIPMAAKSDNLVLIRLTTPIVVQLNLPNLQPICCSDLLPTMPRSARRLEHETEGFRHIGSNPKTGRQTRYAQGTTRGFSPCPRLCGDCERYVRRRHDHKLRLLRRSSRQTDLSGWQESTVRW